MSGQTMYEGHGGDFPESRRPLEKCDGLDAYLNDPYLQVVVRLKSF
jgi:hypothetical protein